MSSLPREITSDKFNNAIQTYRSTKCRDSRIAKRAFIELKQMALLCNKEKLCSGDEIMWHINAFICKHCILFIYNDI